VQIYNKNKTGITIFKKNYTKLWFNLAALMVVLVKKHFFSYNLAEKIDKRIEKNKKRYTKSCFG
tara:strand:+ start:336 stop:527 length:192 start_codon:yes stop_codon:yes gene_type:complete